MSHQPAAEIKRGGLAQYCVEHRGVTWVALIAVLIWGAVSFTKLGQQEDPSIPQRVGLLVTQFPGATALKVEELVTKSLERTVSEMASIEEIKSESRPGLSTLQIKLHPGSQRDIDLEWEKLRNKAREAPLPEGALPPFLASDFGTTITLLFGITSPPASDAECIARANLVREQLAELRAGKPTANRVAVVAFFPSGVSQSYRSFIGRSFKTGLDASGMASDVQLRQGFSFLMADFATSASREQMEKFIARFKTSVTGTEQENHPDFTAPMIAHGRRRSARSGPRDRAAALQLSRARRCRGRFRRRSEASRERGQSHPHRSRAGDGLPALLLGDGGRLRARPECDREGDRGAQRDHSQRHAPHRGRRIFLCNCRANSRTRTISSARSSASGRRARRCICATCSKSGACMKRPFLSRSMSSSAKTPTAPLLGRRAVMVAVEMKPGKIIGHFNDEVQKVAANLRERLPDGMKIETLSDQPAAVKHRLESFHSLVYRGGCHRHFGRAPAHGLALRAGRGDGDSVDRGDDLGRDASLRDSASPNLHRRAHHRARHAGGRSRGRFRRDQPRAASRRRRRCALPGLGRSACAARFFTGRSLTSSRFSP